jgi:hypothetical protein
MAPILPQPPNQRHPRRTHMASAREERRAEFARGKFDPRKRSSGKRRRGWRRRGLSARALCARFHGASPSAHPSLSSSPTVDRLALALHRRRAGDAPWRLPQGAGAQPRSGRHGPLPRSEVHLPVRTALPMAPMAYFVGLAILLHCRGWPGSCRRCTAPPGRCLAPGSPFLCVDGVRNP